jgi:hypothetical protein
LAAPSPCRHYLHTLEGTQINMIRPDAATGAVSVSATFREAVEAHRGSGEPVQAFRRALCCALPRACCSEGLARPNGSLQAAYRQRQAR